MLIFQPYRRIVSPETIKYITEDTKTTTLIICGDDEKFYDESKQYARNANNVMTTNKVAFEKHKKEAGVNVIHAGYSANPKIYKRLNVKKTTEVSFYGAMTDYRIAMLNGIIMKDIPIRVYGNGWRDDSVITTAQCVYLINETKVNLNISIDIVNGKEIPQIKARDFEVPMCGGFLLTHDNPLLEQFYDIGKEVVVYHNLEDLTHKIKKYAKDDTLREKIANAGYKRAKSEHKTVSRWRDIFKKCYFKNGGTNGGV
jgi:spore maturation protein CgeB